MKQIAEFLNIPLAELSTLAEGVLKELKKPSCLLLSGEMASGKTSFSAAFCKLFQVQVTQSPTYAIHQRYSGASGVVIDHFDFYRLSDAEEVSSAGVTDLLQMSSDYKLLEWSERLDPIEIESLGVAVYCLKIKTHEDSSFRDYILYSLN